MKKSKNKIIRKKRKVNQKIMLKMIKKMNNLIKKKKINQMKL
jgi:hypothetical protein